MPAVFMGRTTAERGWMQVCSTLNLCLASRILPQQVLKYKSYYHQIFALCSLTLPSSVATMLCSDPQETLWICCPCSQKNSITDIRESASNRPKYGASFLRHPGMQPALGSCSAMAGLYQPCQKSMVWCSLHCDRTARMPH